LAVAVIRQEPTIAALLVKTKGRLLSHSWPPNVHDVISLGFFVGAIPRYQSSQSFTDSIRKSFSVTVNTDNITPFRCVPTEVSTVFNDHNCKCNAFDLQVERLQAKDFVPLLKKSFQQTDGLHFMFYRHRHRNSHLFAKSIKIQEKYEHDHRVVAIRGIPPSECPLSNKLFTTLSPLSYRRLKPPTHTV
jgi:hypothetical protein